MTNRLREIFGTRNVLCDGAMGTSLYARGIFINRCYDELNLSQPELVRNVHEEYLQAGAIGPLGVHLEPLGKTSLEEARAAYAEQIRGLAEGGVDMLLIETVSALNEAEQAILAARSVAPGLPVLGMVTVDEDATCLDGSSPETAATKFTEWGPDAIGCNCSV